MDWLPGAISTKASLAFQRHVKDPEVEIECVCKGFDAIGFSKLIRHCVKAYGKFDEQVMLDVIHGEVRASMDKDLINDYRANKSFPSKTTYMKKLPVERIVMHDFDSVLNFKRETILDAAPKAFVDAAFNSRDVLVRLKRRYSFTAVPRTVRLDLTVVKEVSRSWWDGVLSSPETFEVEIEYIGKPRSKTGNKQSPSIDPMMQVLKQVIMVKQGTPTTPLGRTQSDGILKAYLQLSGMGKAADIERIKKSPRQYFAGPQPITMELSNVVQVTHDYTVTEKADGERMLLFIDPEGSAFLMNNRLTLLSMAFSIPAASSSLVDCEVIKQQDRYLVLVFDAYFVHGVAVHTEPLITDGGGGRLGAAHHVVDQMTEASNGSPFLVKVKNFAHGDDVFDACRKVLDEPYSYDIDGLIFTPKLLPVGASGPNAAGRLGKSWPLVFKWKPINTIDFLVKDTGLKRVINEQTTRTFELLVATDQTTELVTPMSYLLGRHDRAITLPQVRRPVIVPSRFVMEDDQSRGLMHAVLNASGNPTCANGDVIRHEDIVECSYSGGTWTPLLVRTDKTELFRQTKKIAGAANKLETAVNAWNSIIYPVTEDIIRGAQKLASSSDMSKAYYSRKNDDRNASPLIGLKTFHNIWIKHRLYATFPAIERLCEIACGTANDLNRWLAIPSLTDVFGMDISKHNIEHPIDGAYAKFSRSHARNRIKAVFVQLDAGQVLDDATFERYDGDTRSLCRIMWGYDMPPLGSALTKYYKFASRRFGLVSCQFATHYFFESDAKLEGFVKNIGRLLEVGGYFIGTCFDPVAVDALFDERKSDVVNVHSDEGVLIWELRKRYDMRGGTGKVIDVYIESINRFISEYLVDFDMLNEKLAKYNIFPLTTEEAAGLGLEAGTLGFGSEYERLLQAPPTVRDNLARVVGMSVAEKQLSFMFKWFVYKRHK